MKIDEWLNFFKKHKGKSLFSLQDLAILTDQTKPSLTVQLSRLVKAGTINRAAQGWYENPFNPPKPEQVAMVLRYPSYLSLEYALAEQGVLSQNVQILTLITTKLSYTYSTPKKDYEYHQIKPELFFGYQEEGTVLIAEPEKALLDLIYIRVTHTDEMTVDSILSLADDMETAELDLEALSTYEKSFDERTKQTVKKVIPA